MTRLSLAGSLLALSLSLAGPASAQDAKALVDAAIDRCEIGETIAGYLDQVEGKGAPAEVAAMREINIKRRAVYAELARQQGLAIEVVARVTGEKQLEKATSGQCVMGADGLWTQR